MRVYFREKYQHDYPKKIGEMNLAWYNKGKICLYRAKTEHQMQTQNFYIKEINSIVHGIWLDLSHQVKKEFQTYANAYKKRYPSLRKRGANSYAMFLMAVHTLIKKYQLHNRSQAELTGQLRNMLSRLSIYQLVLCGALKVVKYAYRMNLKLLSPLKSDHNSNHSISSAKTSTLLNAFVIQETIMLSEFLYFSENRYNTS